MADTSLASVGAIAGAANLSLGTVNVTDIGGNLNGYIEPGERATSQYSTPALIPRLRLRRH